MKAKLFFIFLFVLCVIQLTAQSLASYRFMADSMAKAGNYSAADSLYSISIALLPRAEEYIARGDLRRNTEHCRACGDYFKAATMGDSLAVKKIRKYCYREKTTQSCVIDSFSIHYEKGKVMIKQKLHSTYSVIYQSDTAFHNVQKQYVLGKDTLKQFSETCAMPDSIRIKMYQYIGTNYLHRSATILPFIIGYYSNPAESSSDVKFTVSFSHDGVVLDAEREKGERYNYYDDAIILKLLTTMPPIGNWGCVTGVYRYTFVIYCSRQW